MILFYSKYSVNLIITNDSEVTSRLFRRFVARLQWGYKQAIGATLSRGDWFLDPARAVAFHASFEGNFSLEYVYNPFLNDLRN